jgi:DNA modification methylase
MRTLNGEQTNRAVEKHVCPLQFDIVDRLIERYSNKGELVYDPFCGLGTVPVRAIKAGRAAAARSCRRRTSPTRCTT